jgi:hypothetical protein
MPWIDKLANLVFRCWHRRLSRPMSLPRDSVRTDSSPVGYVVCLDCGKRFSYDLVTLTKGPPIENDVDGAA